MQSSVKKHFKEKLFSWECFSFLNVEEKKVFTEYLRVEFKLKLFHASILLEAIHERLSGCFSNMKISYNLPYANLHPMRAMRESEREEKKAEISVKLSRNIPHEARKEGNTWASFSFNLSPPPHSPLPTHT